MAKKVYRTIVVGTDGSPLAPPTVGRAAWLAAHENAQLIVVCAGSSLSRRGDARNTMTIGGDARVSQVLGHDAARKALDDAMAVARDYGVDTAAALLVEGDAAAALLNTIDQRNADLLVVGARRDVTIAERLLGTVASEVVRRARCDVLVVRPSADVGLGDLVVPESAD